VFEGRISQQKETFNAPLIDPEFRNLRFECLNDFNLEWVDCFENIISRGKKGKYTRSQQMSISQSFW
jgi:hypothetical protein